MQSDVSLAGTAPYLRSLARRGLEAPDQVRFRAQLLANARDDLAQSTGSLFPWTLADTTDEIFAAYASDHRLGEPRHFTDAGRNLDPRGLGRRAPCSASRVR